MNFSIKNLINLVNKCYNIYFDNKINEILKFQYNFNFIIVYLNLINDNFLIINNNNNDNNDNNDNKEYIEIINKSSKELLEILFSDFLQVGNWNNIENIWKNLYSYSIIFYVFSKLLLIKTYNINNINNQNINENNLKLLDYAILFGGSDKLFNEIINDFIKILNNNNNDNDNNSRLINYNSNIINNNNISIKLNKNNLIKRFNKLSLEDFNKLDLNEPFIIENYMNLWPCFSKENNQRNWNNLNYLKKIAGHRTVAIEIGKNYLDENLKQKLINFNDFIQEFIINDNVEEIGYLAQTKLLDQIPELKNDIKIPEYCQVDENNVTINAWFGPKGTTTPLHYDPKNNFLSQVVGYKYIKLFSHKYFDNLYPNLNSKLYFNTSMVDIENPNYEKFPKYKEISDNCFLECILNPGDILFIPKKYFHFVKSLSISFSLSFWW